MLPCCCLQAVLGWGEEAGAPWACDLPGPLSLTPLHLAAAIPEPATAAAVLEQLLLRCASGAAVCAAAWRSARTADGLTAEQFAGLSGVGEAAAEVLARLAPAAAEAAREGGSKQRGQGDGQWAAGSEPSESVQQPSTPRRCRWGASTECRLLLLRCLLGLLDKAPLLCCILYPASRCSVM